MTLYPIPMFLFAKFKKWSVPKSHLPPNIFLITPLHCLKVHHQNHSSKAGIFLGFCQNGECLVQPLFFVCVCVCVCVFIFNWRIMALHHCVGFCCTSAWVGHGRTYVPSLLSLSAPSHPIPPLLVVTDPGLTSLSHTANSRCLFHIRQCVCVPAAPLSSQPFFPPLCPQVCSLCLWLHCFLQPLF